MSYLELILQNPIQNLPTLGFILVGFVQVARQVLKLFSTQQNLQAGNQAIITQDNTLQSKLIEFMAALQKEIVDRRIAEDSFRNRLADILDEKVTRIDGTTLATSADVKAIAAKLDRFDKGFGMVFRLLKTKGVI